MKKLRACVIGMGPIGNRHADLYLGNQQVELIGVCDIIAERSDKAGKRLGCASFTNAAEMLSKQKPDIVSVTTGGIEYGSDHYEPTMQSLESGAHVLCEKPICNDIGKATEMVAKAQEKKRCFGINFNHRFTPAARLAKQWMDAGRIGSLLFVNMAMWIKNPNESSPFFQIQALNPHSVDIMRHFCGDVEAVQCFATKAPGRAIWSTSHFSMRFTNGAVGSLTSSYDIERGHPMERCEVAGLKGRFVIDDMWREATLYPAGDMVKLCYSNPVFGGMRDFTDTFRNRIGKFVEQVAAGCDPTKIDGSGADGLEAQRVLAAAIVSIKTGQVVKLADLK